MHKVLFVFAGLCLLAGKFGTMSGGVGGTEAIGLGVILILIGGVYWALVKTTTPATALPATSAESYEWLWFPLAALVSITTGCHYYWGWSWLWSIVVAVIIISVAIWVIRQPAQVGEVGIGIARGIWWLTTRLVVVLRAIATVLWAIPVVGTILAWLILAIVVVGGFYLFFKYGFWPLWETHCWIDRKSVV